MIDSELLLVPSLVLDSYHSVLPKSIRQKLNCKSKAVYVCLRIEQTILMTFRRYVCRWQIRSVERVGVAPIQDGMEVSSAEFVSNKFLEDQLLDWTPGNADGNTISKRHRFHCRYPTNKSHSTLRL